LVHGRGGHLPRPDADRFHCRRPPAGKKRLRRTGYDSDHRRHVRRLRWFWPGDDRYQVCCRVSADRARTCRADHRPIRASRNGHRRFNGAGLVGLCSMACRTYHQCPTLDRRFEDRALILFINALNGAQTGALSGFEAFKSIAYVNLFIGLLSFPILIAGAYFGGLTGAVWALAINLCFNWLLNHIALRIEARRCKVPFTLRHCSHELPILWRFSLPAVLASSLVGPVNWLCATFLVNQPDGYGEMGIFNAANQWYAMLMFLPGLLGGVVLPVLSERLGQKDTNQSMKAMVFSIKANALFVMPLVVLAGIASPYIMSLYGAGFRDGWPTLVVVLLTAGLLAVQTPVGQIIAASGKMWIGFVMNLGWALTFIIATLLLVEKGSLGLASARACSYVIHATWTFGFAIWLIRKGASN